MGRVSPGAVSPGTVATSTAGAAVAAAVVAGELRTGPQSGEEAATRYAAYMSARSSGDRAGAWSSAVAIFCPATESPGTVVFGWKGRPFSVGMGR